MGIVEREIERRERKLPPVKHARRRELRLVHSLDDFGRNLFRRIAVISRESIEHFFVPNPVLQHLRGRFDEIARHMSSSKTTVLGPCRDRMQRVSELVEERFHVGVRH